MFSAISTANMSSAVTVFLSAVIQFHKFNAAVLTDDIIIATEISINLKNNQVPSLGTASCYLWQHLTYYKVSRDHPLRPPYSAYVSIGTKCFHGYMKGFIDPTSMCPLHSALNSPPIPDPVGSL